MTSRRRLAAAVPLLLLLACGGPYQPGIGPGVRPNPGSGSGSGGGGGGGGISVRGQVLDGTRQPIPSRTVLIGAQSAVTDATGNFSLDHVTAPYDLTVITIGQENMATIYQGLTRVDPKVLDFASPGSLSNHAHVTGNLLGGDPLPSATGTTTAISWGSPETVGGNYVTSNPYDLQVGWSGANSIIGTLHALQWTVDASGLPTAYKGQGVKNGVSLTAGGTTAGTDMTIAVPLTQTVSGMFTVPTGFTIDQRFVSVDFADGASFPVGQDASSATGFSFLVPADSSATASVGAGASSGAIQTLAQLSGIAPGTTDASISLPTRASTTLPVNGAAGVNTGTEFTWTPLAGGLHFVFISGGTGDPTFAIITAGTTTRIPDLTAQGLALPKAKPYDWVLIGRGPYGSVDAFAGTASLTPPGLFVFESFATASFTTQ